MEWTVICASSCIVRTITKSPKPEPFQKENINGVRLDFIDSLRGIKREGGFSFKSFTNSDDKYTIEIPINWRLVGVRDEYGHLFSDEERKEGMLTVRSVSALFSNLEKYSADLVAGMEEKSGYRVLSQRDITIHKKHAVEIVFVAEATVNGKKKDAAILMAIIHNPATAQFFLLSYSVLEEDMNKLAVIYTHARDSFQIS